MKREIPLEIRRIFERRDEPRRGKCAAPGAPGKIVMNSREAQNWARFLIDQYGAEAEELAEVGIIEMLAFKNDQALIAWALIFAAIRQRRAHESGDAACRGLRG